MFGHFFGRMEYRGVALLEGEVHLDVFGETQVDVAV